MKQNGIWYNLKLLMVMSFLVTLASCVESGSGNKKKSSASSSSSSGGSSDVPETPTFESSLNFFQEGSTQSTSGITIPVSFNDRFYLRGKQIDFYISNGNTTSSKCLVFSYTSGTTSYLVATATPQYFYNFSTNTQEYYYLISPGDEVKNKTFCQTPGVQATLSAQNPTYNITYSLLSVCPTCSSGLFNSSTTTLYSDAGNEVTDADVNQLSLTFSNTISNPGSPGIICTSSAVCKTQGYDCCVSGQCVNDQSLKTGVDTSLSAYQDALAAISLDPTLYSSYPQYYNLCPIIITPEPTVPPITNPALTAQQRLEELYELYLCTTPQDGEVSYCTTTVENISNLSATVFTPVDDRNFNTYYSGTAAIPNHSIHTITYGGQVYFENDNFLLAGITIGPGGNLSGNDTLTDPQELTFGVTPTLADDTLKVTYKVDGSCRQVGTTLAKCDKYFVQGQNLGKASDHYPASQIFNLPYYADASKTISVTVDDAIVQNGADWTANNSAPSYVEFQSSFQVFDTQIIKITFYVDTTVHAIIDSKLIAQQEIAIKCDCPDLTCSLKPVYVGNSLIASDFVCEYPQPNLPPAPLQQTVLLSSKTVPMRFYDNDNGVEHQNVNLTTPVQEGLAFEYTSGDLTKPNNVASDIGFNEINGSISGQPGAATEAKEVVIVKGKTYDIFVNTGTFSSCFYCGTDYFSNLAKIFPSNFIFKGGGYFPHPSSTDVTTSEMRSHDLIFGRACFVPATMLPFSHVAKANRQDQRKDRMSLQHFYFANGYQRDWFGFDYGSVIGSFDGVTWFSVGNQRRIKAVTNRLYLAINAYYGDQTIENSFSIDVNEASTTPNSGAFVQLDYDSDGAQCQKYHSCDTDRDCAAKLGWEYSCASVSSLQSAWPVFDQNGKEIPGQSKFLRLISMNGGSSGPSKRCVYRGRGAACLANFNTISNPSDTFNQTDDAKLFSCASNSYCQAFNSPGKVPAFNTKISRYAKSIKTLIAQGTLSSSDEDSFGLSAKVLGRPYDYNGTGVIPNQVLSNATQVNVSAICLPGKNVEPQTPEFQNYTVPDTMHFGDKVNNLGMTRTSLSSIEPSYLSSCPTFDSSGTYVQNSLTLSTTLNDDVLITSLAGSQNVSTNSLLPFNNTGQLTQDFDLGYVNTKMLQPNRCLRAPGATCHTNFECAANKFITDKTKSVSNGPSIGMLNAELEFWQSTLVCSQEVSKIDPDFDAKNNRCCRLMGNKIIISNEIHDDVLSPETSKVPGIDIEFTNARRYTAITPAYAKMKDTPSEYPQLKVGDNDRCPLTSCPATEQRPLTELIKQYNTLNEVAAKTCCTGNWVRNFDSSNTGGGHTWSPSKMQLVDKTNFQCLNWAESVISPEMPSASNFSCSGTAEPDDPACNMRSISTSEANIYLAWFAKFELTGIAQVPIEGKADTSLRCSVTPGNWAVSGTAVTIPGYIGGGTPAYEYEGGHYSANDMSNFDSKKQVFSDSEFTCCQPVGTQMVAGDDPGFCCSGNINPDTNKCALKNYTNLSVYFNKYVSSEAKDLSESLIDPETGYIKNASTVQQLACAKEACASGFVGYGIAHTDLKVPGHEASDKQVKRFIDGDDLSNDFSGKAKIFNEGLRWNNQVYCVPQELAQSSGDVLQIFNCGTNP
ncbi:hypothetical protein A9Q84_06375 [Halobacteriovorax marinus]|uniref:Lipoprotein n=1 Tax=Halobacteriovorax marinus TaxID=97084 RepID=A0A1Y5F9K1_9BACT|nr:hypothetical protein A9Q84_06375 [Halobacteriovorax marinus]